MNLAKDIFNKLTEQETNYLNSYVDENYVRKEDIYKVWKNYSTPTGNGYRELRYKDVQGFINELFRLL